MGACCLQKFTVTVVKTAGAYPHQAVIILFICSMMEPITIRGSHTFYNYIILNTAVNVSCCLQ